LRIKVDEDLPVVVAEKLSALGYEADTVIDQGMGGWKDPQLWVAVQSEGRFLVTADKGFGDIRVYPPGRHYGVLLLRPDEDGIRPLLELVDSVLAHYRLEALVGLLAVVTPRGVRIRRA
jgi:predicted nuclease of predicted toxin-antitoxin system